MSLTSITTIGIRFYFSAKLRKQTIKVFIIIYCVHEYLILKFVFENCTFDISTAYLY